ncbi:MAG: hypothetical protein V9H25_17410 [Candidatus Competibacter sp.]
MASDHLCADHRPNARRCPAAAWVADAPEAGFVLEHQPNWATLTRGVLHRVLNEFGEFF